MSCSVRRTCLPVLALLAITAPLNMVSAQQPAPDSAAGRDSSVGRRAVVLTPIHVVGLGERDAYRADRTTTLTRTDSPLRDSPQSVSVVTRSLISDLHMTSLADVVRYVPGATMAQGEGHRDQPTIRGNNSNSDLFVDGIRDDVEYFRDVYNIERVEVPRGSNALVFGRGAGGGLINRVTKVASWTPVGGLTFHGGGHNSKRGTLDLGRGLGPPMAARLNGLYENSESYRRGFNLRRYGIAPAVTLAAGVRGSVRAGYEHFNDHRTVDRGVPSFQGRPVATDPAIFFGDPGLSYADAAVDAVTAVLEQRPVAGLTVRSHGRYADYRKFYQNVFPGAVSAAGDRVSLTAYHSRLRRRNLFNQTELIYPLRTGGAHHLLLGGAEFGRQVTDAFRATGYFNDAAPSVDVPLASPTLLASPWTFRQSATDADASTTALVAGGYLQDQVRFSPGVLALAGVRFDRFDLRYHDQRGAPDLRRTDHALSPRLGLVLKPATPLSAYLSYGVSFLPASGNQFTSLTVTTQTLEPERFTNYEAGLKWEARPELSLTAAVYQLDRTNSAAPDPVVPGRTIQTGSQRSRGVEVTATGRPARGWQLMLGYGGQDVRITGRTTGAPAGAAVPLTPRHQLSVWTRYQATRVVGLGLGLIHQTSMFAAVDNAVTLPGFTRVDAALYVRVADWARLQLNGENLLDARYYPTAHSNHNITPGSPRTVTAGLDIRYGRCCFTAPAP